MAKCDLSAVAHLGGRRRKAEWRRQPEGLEITPGVISGPKWLEKGSAHV